MGHGAYVRKPNEIDFGIHWGRIEQHAERNVLPVGLEAAPELVRANKHVRLLRVLQHARPDYALEHRASAAHHAPTQGTSKSWPRRGGGVKLHRTYLQHARAHRRHPGVANRLDNESDVPRRNELG